MGVGLLLAPEAESMAVCSSSGAGGVVLPYPQRSLKSRVGRVRAGVVGVGYLPFTAEPTTMRYHQSRSVLAEKQGTVESPL